MKNIFILLGFGLFLFTSCTKDQNWDDNPMGESTKLEVDTHYNNGAAYAPIIVGGHNGEYIYMEIEAYECHIPEGTITWGGRGYKAVGSPINILAHEGDACQLYGLEFQITADRAEIDLRFPIIDRSENWKVTLTGNVGDLAFEDSIQD